MVAACVYFTGASGCFVVDVPVVQGLGGGFQYGCEAPEGMDEVRGLLDSDPKNPGRLQYDETTVGQHLAWS